MLLPVGTIYYGTQETLLSSQGAMEPALGLAPYGLTVPIEQIYHTRQYVHMELCRLAVGGYPSLALKGRAFRRVLVSLNMTKQTSVTYWRTKLCPEV